MKRGDLVCFKAISNKPEWFKILQGPVSRLNVVARVLAVHGSGMRVQVMFDEKLASNGMIGRAITSVPLHFDIRDLEVVREGDEPEEVPQLKTAVAPVDREFKAGDIVRFKDGMAESLKWFRTLDPCVKPYIFGEVKGYSRLGQLVLVQFSDRLGLNRNIKIHRQFMVDKPTKLNPRRLEKVPEALLAGSIDQALGRVYRRCAPPVTVSHYSAKEISDAIVAAAKRTPQMNNIMYKTKAVLDRAQEDLRLNKAALNDRNLAKKMVAQKAKEFSMMDDLGCRIQCVTVALPDVTDHTNRFERIIRCLEACATTEIPWSEDVEWVMADKSTAWKGGTTSPVTVNIPEE